MVPTPIGGSQTEFRVRLFGGPRLHRGLEEIALSPFQANLLLIVFGREAPSLTRLEACSLLWPGEESARARRRLSQHLYTLGKKTSASTLIETRPREIRKAVEGVSSDLEAFADALREGSFQICYALIQEGFGSGAPGLEDNRPLSDWIQARDAELRRELRRHAQRLWRTAASKEDWEGALSAAEALSFLDPKDEMSLQQLMEARAKMGQTAEAEEAFRAFSAQFPQKAWKPKGKTKALLGAIRSTSHIPADSLIKEVRREKPRSPLLGRDDERNQLRRDLRRVPETGLRGFLISGEAGIGKTRLIEESVQGLSLDGQRILSAEAAELERPIPLNPIIELFKGEAAGEALRNLNEPWRTVLYGVMPGHYLEGGPIPAAPQIQQGSIPRRLFEAIFKLLIALVQDRPVILVLEDLQWADETTLTVLEFLARRWDRGSLQLLASVRSEEIRRNEVLARFLGGLRMSPAFKEIPLSELGPNESEALIQHLARRELRSTSLSQLRSLAGGNPYFLIELTLEFLAGRLGPEVTPQDIVPIPLSIRQVLGRRLDQLSDYADRVLGPLAVFSRALDLQGLSRITGLSESDCVSGLDQLEEFRLVSFRNREARISHELVRQTVYQTLTESTRTWLHGQIAAHILRTRETAPADELAVHFHEAGASLEAIHYAREAADHAQASGAIPEAIRFLRIAREHSTEPETVVGLINQMGHLHYLHQNLEEAAPLLEIAAQRFRRQGDQAQALKAEVERIDCLAKTAKYLGRDCLEELRIIKREAQDSGLWEVYHDALDVEAHQLDRDGDLAGVRSVLDQAADHLNRGTVAARCKGLAMVALQIYFGSSETGISAARKAVSLALSTSDNELILHALNRLILTLHYHGRLQTTEGAKALAEAESRLGTCGDLILKFHVQLNPAVWYLEIGELDFARNAFAKLGNLLQGTKAQDAKARLHLNLGELGLASHDLDAAKQAYEKAEELIVTPSPHYFQALTTAGLGLCALIAGNLAEARRREEELPPFPDFWTYDPTVLATFKARLMVNRRDLSGAMGLLDQIRDGLEERWAPIWLRLTLEEARLLRRWSPEKASSLAKDGLVTAGQLDLSKRVRELTTIIQTLSK